MSKIISFDFIVELRFRDGFAKLLKLVDVVEKSTNRRQCLEVGEISKTTNAGNARLDFK